MSDVLNRFPLAGFHDSSNTSFVPMEPRMCRQVPCAVSRVPEGTDLTWVFPNQEGSLLTNPLLCATLQIVQPIGTSLESMIPLVFGTARNGWYDLFANWRINIGGITILTPTPTQISDWILEKSGRLDNEAWQAFQDVISCRYTHCSELISGAAATSSPFGKRRLFYSAKLDRSANTVTYLVDLTLPVPCLDQFIPLNPETRKAYPYGVFPCLFGEKLIVTANFNRQSRNIPTCPTVHYEGTYNPAIQGDFSARPPLARSKNTNGGDTLTTSRSIAAHILMSPASNISSPMQPSILNSASACYWVPSYYAFTPAVADRTSQNPTISWIVGNSPVVVEHNQNNTAPAGGAVNSPAGGRMPVYSAQAIVAGDYVPTDLYMDTSPESWLAAQNLLGSGTVKQFGPACNIVATSPQNLQTSYFEWGSGATSYLGIPIGTLGLPGGLEEYLPQEVIGVFANGKFSSNLCDIDPENCFTGLLDPSGGLRNPSQVAVSARVEHLQPCPTFAAPSYLHENFTLTDPFGPFNWTLTKDNATAAPAVIVNAQPLNPDLFSTAFLQAYNMVGGTSSMTDSLLLPAAALFYTSGYCPRAIATHINQAYASYGLPDTAFSNQTTLVNFNQFFYGYPSTPISNVIVPTPFAFSSGFAAITTAATQAPTTASGAYNLMWSATLPVTQSAAALPIPAVAATVPIAATTYIAASAYGSIRPNLSSTAVCFSNILLNVSNGLPTVQTAGNPIVKNGANPTTYPFLNGGGGHFAGKNAFYAQSSPLIYHALHLLRSAAQPAQAASSLVAALQSRSRACVLSSRFYFQHPSNFEAKHWNYSADTSSLDNAVAAAPDNQPGPALPANAAVAPTPANLADFASVSHPLCLSSFYEYIPTAAQRVQHDIRTHQLLLDTSEHFLNPFDLNVDQAVGTYDNHQWFTDTPRAVLSGRPALSTLYQGVCSRIGQSKANVDIVNPLISSSAVQPAPSAAALAAPAAPTINSTILSQMNNPFSGSEARTIVRSAQDIGCFLAMGNMATTQTNGAAVALGVATIANFAFGLIPTCAFDVVPYAHGIVGGNSTNGQSFYTLTINTLAPTALPSQTTPQTSYGSGHSTGSYYQMLADFTTSSVYAANSSPAQANIAYQCSLAVAATGLIISDSAYTPFGCAVAPVTYLTGAVTPRGTNATTAALMYTCEQGRFRASASQNFGQSYCHYPMFLIGVIGGGYAPLGVGQTSSPHLLDAMGFGNVHVPSPYLNSSSRASKNVAPAGNEVSLDPLFPPGIDAAHISTALGPYPAIPAPIMCHPGLDVTIRYIVHCPAFPDLLTPSIQCMVSLLLPCTKFSVVDSSGMSSKTREAFQQARDDFRGNGIHTICCDIETLYFSVPKTSTSGSNYPNIPLTLMGDMVHGIGIRAVNGNINTADFQQPNITGAVIDYNATTLYTLTSDLLRQPSTPFYVPLSSLQSNFSSTNYYTPGTNSGSGVWSFAKIGNPAPFSEQLDSILFRSIDAACSWNMDRLRNQPWAPLYIPLGTNGPLHCNGTLQLKLTTAPYESNSTFPTILFQFVPHPLASTAQGGAVFTSTAPNTAGYSGFTNVIYGCPPVEVGAAGASYGYTLPPAGGITFKTFPEFSPYFFNVPNNIRQCQGYSNKRPLMVNGSSAGAVPNTSGGGYTFCFRGMVTDSLITHPFFPPEWLNGATDYKSYTTQIKTVGTSFFQMASTAMTGIAATPGYGASSAAVNSAVPAPFKPLPPTRYQPFGIKEFQLNSFDPLGESPIFNIEVKIFRTKNGLLRASDASYFTKI